MTELMVILKDESRTYRQKFIVYEDYTASAEDELILRHIDEAKMNFDGEPESIEVKIHIEVE
jgi:hypothetical protein